MSVFLWTFENKRKRDEWIRLLGKLCWLKIQVLLKLSAIFEIFISVLVYYIVRFEWDIVFSSSYDGWDKRGYTMWCPREGTSTLLICVWLYLKVVQI